MAQEHERHELTDFQKGEIVEGRKFSSHVEIAHDLTIPRRTVFGFLTNYDQRITSDNLYRSGRPRKLSESDIRYLVRRAESDTDVPLKEISIKCVSRCFHMYPSLTIVRGRNSKMESCGKNIIDSKTNCQTSQVGKSTST